MTPVVTVGINQSRSLAEVPVELEVAFPEASKSLSQDAEWCVVRVEDEWRRIRFHEYGRLFEIPGLYEKVIYEVLECSSPATVCGLLVTAVMAAGESAQALRTLDLGAGNGIAGQELVQRGARLIVGVDIIEEAAQAAERDRPGIYDDYLVADFTCLNSAERRRLSAYDFNCLVCVAALGFGDIPPEAFTTAYNFIRPNGWIALNIKENFLEQGDQTGFAALLRSMVRSGALDVRKKTRYRHRLGTDTKPIHYLAIVGRKRSDIRPR